MSCWRLLVCIPRMWSDYINKFVANLEYLTEQAARRGVKFGWIHAIAREQPPVSVSDLIKQRRRWYTGIMSMDSWLVKLVLAIPMMGPLAYGSVWVFRRILLALTLISTVFSNLYTLVRGWNISVSHWFFVWNLCNVAVDTHGLIVGSVLQDLYLGDTPLGSLVLHIILTLLWAPFVQFAHSIIFISALICPTSNFVVIKKIWHCADNMMKIILGW